MALKLRTGGSKGAGIITILELLEELGNTPEHVKVKILSETNPDTLKEWNKLAARADSVDDFVKMSGIVCNN